MLIYKIIIVASILSCLYSDDLYGYDCNEPGVTTQVISLVDVGECTSADAKPDKVQGYGQLLQLSSITRVKVTNCRVFKSSWIYRCGMHSHQMLVGGPFLNVPVHLSKETCQDMINWGKYSVSNKHVIEGIKVNRTISSTITEEGSLDTDGSCDGLSITYLGQTYAKSFMRSVYEIRIKQYYADVDTTSNKIFLHDDLHCSHDVGYCQDDIAGYSYWEPYDAPCEHQLPLLLHEGLFSLIKEDNIPTLVHIKEQKFMFISKLNGGTNMCGRQVYTTDFQNIVLLISDTMNPKLQAKAPTQNQINPSLYMNAKLSYLNYKTVEDITDIYHDILRQLCLIERKVLFNLLDLIRLTHQPTKHVKGLEQKGTLLHVKGEVAYITTCPIKKVILRPSTTCYDGLPVLVANTSMFLLPVSRLIVPNVTEYQCNVVAPPLFKLDNTWISMTPNYVRTSPPTILSPRTKLNIGPTVIKGFAEGGIYSSSDLEQFYKALTHGETREATLDHITVGIMTNTPIKYNLMNTINEDGWKMVVKNNLTAMWGRFIILGEVISGFIGIYFIYIIISRLIQLIIRTFSLHRIYGCSWKLGAGIWSATTLLLTTFFKSTTQDNPPDPQNHNQTHLNEKPKDEEDNEHQLRLLSETQSRVIVSEPYQSIYPKNLPNEV